MVPRGRYALFPYSCFQQCANVDELTDQTLESGGITHDQVPDMLGLDLERYECPLARVRAAGAGYQRRTSTLEQLERASRRVSDDAGFDR